MLQESLNSILIIFASLAILLAAFYAFFGIYFPKKNKENEASLSEEVSIVIAFYNELENLKKLLPKLLNQNMTEFELVLVDDGSDDASVSFIESLNDDRIKLHRLEKNKGKKAAIIEGIKKTKNDLLLFIDSDCEPRSKNWIMLMTKDLKESKKISIGYGGFYKKSSLLNAIQRYENAVNSIQNYSFAQAGKAYMAVGRNLAYRKDIFLRSSVFKSYADIKSGDDDLLVNEMSRSNNTICQYELDSQTVSKAKESWAAYFIQKRRQLEAGKYYRKMDRVKLAIIGLAQLIYTLLFIILMTNAQYLHIILAIFVFKTSLQLLFYYQPLKKLGEEDLWLLSPILEGIYVPLISLIGLSQYLWKVDRWK